jgi:hypothetical protein
MLMCPSQNRMTESEVQQEFHSLNAPLRIQQYWQANRTDLQIAVHCSWPKMPDALAPGLALRKIEPGDCPLQAGQLAANPNLFRKA